MIFYTMSFFDPIKLNTFFVDDVVKKIDDVILLHRPEIRRCKLLTSCCRLFLSCRETVCLCWRGFGRYFSHHLAKSDGWPADFMH